LSGKRISDCRTFFSPYQHISQGGAFQFVKPNYKSCRFDFFYYCGRQKQRKDHHRFLEISPGSPYEPETQLLIAEAVNYGNDLVRKEIMQAVQDEPEMLVGFMGKLAK
jgi:hypothetical protein